MKKFLIIPNCSDLNRGDQALVWETKRLAEDAGCIGEYYVTAEDNEPVEQSIKHGLNPISMLLKHPSRFFKKNDNITYSFSLKLKWGFVAFFDLIVSLLMLNGLLRKILLPLQSKEKKVALNVFSESDAVFVKGGGFVHYYGGLTSLYYAYFSLYHIFYAASLKKKIYFMPNSIGPLEGPGIKWIVKKAIKKCEFVAVRETFSQEMVRKELGIELPYAADLAFYLKNSSLTKAEIYEKYNIPQGRKLVALTMRPHRFPKSQTPKEDYLKFKSEMAKFIEWLYAEGFMPMPIDHTLAINTNENDAVCIKEVTEMCNPEHYFYFSDRSLNCHELKSVYNACDYIVGTRFHSVIFSFANKKPGLAIRYTGNKAQGIMNDIGLLDYSISIDDVTCENLKTKFSNLLANEEHVIQKIEVFIAKANDSRLNLITKIKNSL